MFALKQYIEGTDISIATHISVVNFFAISGFFNPKNCGGKCPFAHPIYGSIEHRNLQ